jgi:hypothetical protein
VNWQCHPIRCNRHSCFVIIRCGGEVDVGRRRRDRECEPGAPPGRAVPNGAAARWSARSRISRLAVRACSEVMFTFATAAKNGSAKSGAGVRRTARYCRPAPETARCLDVNPKALDTQSKYSPGWSCPAGRVADVERQREHSRSDDTLRGAGELGFARLRRGQLPIEGQIGLRRLRPVERLCHRLAPHEVE